MKPAIRIEGVSKRYRLGPNRLNGNLTENLKAGAERVWLGLTGRQPSLASESKDFWALKDVSFDAEPGEVVAIIGRNGAGKSTLLKVLSRIVEPTAGRVTIRGRMGSLLEVGTGFHPELTGRENVYLNGSILGMSQKEIVRKFDEIVAFSGVERFLDTPVKRYSSGMYVRLAFAVAAHLDPEILVVDEVLAVGDQEFQQKCVGKMRSVSGEGRTVLFVSHNLTVVQSLCSRAVLLSAGKVKTIGPTAAVVDEYLSTQARDVLTFDRSLDVREAVRWGGSGEARFAEVVIYDPANPAAKGGFRGGDLGFRLRLTGKLAEVHAVGVQISDESDRKLINANTLEQIERIELGPAGVAELEIFNVNLRPGRYKVGFWCGAGEMRHIDVVTDSAMLEVPARHDDVDLASRRGVPLSLSDSCSTRNPDVTQTDHAANTPSAVRRTLRALMGLIRPDPSRLQRSRPPFDLRKGSLQGHEEELLKHLVERANEYEGPIIEIGALFGMTTVRIAQWKTPRKPLIAVDNFGWNPLGLQPHEHRELTTAILTYPIAICCVTLVESGKNEYYDAYVGPAPSLVFLDAIHSYEETKRDIEWARRCEARIVCGHDYSNEFPGVQRAVDEAGGAVELAGTVWSLSHAKRS